MQADDLASCSGQFCLQCLSGWLARVIMHEQGMVLGGQVASNGLPRPWAPAVMRA